MKKIFFIIFFICFNLFAQEYPSVGFEKYNGLYEIIPPTVSKFTNVLFDNNKMIIYNKTLKKEYPWIVNNHYGRDYFFIVRNMYVTIFEQNILTLIPVTEETIQTVYLRKIR